MLRLEEVENLFSTVELMYLANYYSSYHCLTRLQGGFLGRLVGSKVVDFNIIFLHSTHNYSYKIAYIYFWLHKINIQTMYLQKYPYLHSDAFICIHFYRYYNKPSKSRLVQDELWYENPSLSPSSLIHTLKLV